MSCHLPKDMLALSVFLILFSQDIFGLESKAFPFDINPGPVLEPELRNYTRGKREICEATRGLFPMADKIRLRAAHNNYRRQMKIPGTNVRRLDWNIHLAQRAQAWADKCIYEHDYLFECSGERMGQNLFVSWGDTVFPELNVRGVVKAWHDEINFYDLTTNTCSAVCGHYKQVVWAKSQYFGCGVAYCPTLTHPGVEDKKYAVYVVCNYSPPGNYNDNRPYNAGTSCSECPADTKCKNNLCIPA